EIHDLRVAAIVDEDVRRLQIEMNDAEVMDVVKSGGDLQNHVVQRGPAVSVEILGDLLPREVLHREVREAIVQQPELANLHDALVLERGQRREFSLESEELLRLGELVAKDLD